MNKTINTPIEIEKKECKCGCGILIYKFDSKGRERYYKFPHQSRIKTPDKSWNRGKTNVFSEGTLEKMRIAKLGNKLSEKHKKNIGLSMKKNDVFENKIRRRSRDYANGHLIANNECDICRSTNNLQKHHWRYDKPYLINTLCKQCHTIQHIKTFNESKYHQEVLI